jgi:hypothetical protein
MNTFSNIQSEPGWSTVTGPSIGPAIPQIKTSQVTDGFCTALLVDVTGVSGKYADGMVRSAAAPLPANFTQVTTRFVFAVSAGHAASSQADEFGLMFTNGEGDKLYHVIQFDNSTSPTQAMLDVTGPTYEWASTGATVAKFAPGVLHVLDIVGAYDAAGKKTAIFDVVLNGVQIYAPGVPLWVPAQALKWGPDIWFVEHQPDMNPKGGNHQIKIYSIGVTFS